MCQAVPTPPEGYKLVWADEFNVNGPPNPKSWVFEEGFQRNRELQWYQKENAVCKDGVLVIEGKKVSQPNSNFSVGHKDWKKSRKTIEYTSACLTTKGTHPWQFGRFEIRAKIPAANGLWPAIWTLGVEGQWPSNGEVDILECYKGQILAIGGDAAGSPEGTKFPVRYEIDYVRIYQKK
jgi:beta-glucanase (GH16 family)